MKKQYKPIILTLLLAFLSASCGGSGNGNDPQVASGGIGGTGVSQGTIDGFGSIILNGVKFNTDTADFTIDDDAPLKGDAKTLLREGMQVTVRVDDSGVTATEVVYEAEVEGPLDSNTGATNTLVVMGRTVVVDDSTVIEDNATPPATLSQAELNFNDMLEVSGMVLADGSIQATHIKRRDDITVGPETELELKGIITNVDGVAKTLVIAGITIDFGTGSPTFERMTEGDLAPGLLIEVKGTRASALSSLVASEIKKEDGLGANAADKLEIEGVVSDFDSISGDFSINGQAVSTSASTTFERGASDDIVDNIRLEVEGTLTGGVLVAKKVKFHGNRIKMEADVTNKGSIPNTLTLLGNPVVINGLTELKGLSFGGITTDRLKIRGYLSNGVVTATRVETGSGGDVTLQAPIEAISGADLTDLTLLGNTVTTANVITFRNVDGKIISSEVFFAQVSKGTVVKVKGPLDLNGTTIDAVEVEIED